jgi:hypothetical protein
MNELQLQVEKLKEKFLPEYYKSIDVNEGWYQLIVDCDKELTAIDPHYQIVQIKEKFGGLRYYFHPSQSDTSEAMRKVVEKYEAIALVTCEATGGLGVLMKGVGGWLKTLNPEYAKTTIFYKNYKIIDRNLSQ